MVTIFRQVRKKKRSLHEAIPRKGRSAPNRDATRNRKNTKESRGFSLYDKVTVGGQVGLISGFTSNGSAAYVKDASDDYIPVVRKSYLGHMLSTVVQLGEITIGSKL